MASINNKFDAQYDVNIGNDEYKKGKNKTKVFPSMVSIEEHLNLLSPHNFDFSKIADTPLWFFTEFEYYCKKHDRKVKTTPYKILNFISNSSCRECKKENPPVKADRDKSILELAKKIYNCEYKILEPRNKQKKGKVRRLFFQCEFNHRPFYSKYREFLAGGGCKICLKSNHVNHWMKLKINNAFAYLGSDLRLQRWKHGIMTIKVRCPKGHQGMKMTAQVLSGNGFNSKVMPDNHNDNYNDSPTDFGYNLECFKCRRERLGKKKKKNKKPKKSKRPPGAIKNKDKYNKKKGNN